MITQKMIDKAKSNIMVHVIFKYDKTECECVGAIIKSSDREIYVSLNTIDDAVKDSVTIARKDIKSIARLKRMPVFTRK